nr:ADM_HP1_G0005880.mRNA.1.CDS.1 [Saccharomyces cerevisiae]
MIKYADGCTTQSTKLVPGRIYYVMTDRLCQYSLGFPSVYLYVLSYKIMGISSAMAMEDLKNFIFQIIEIDLIL